MRRVLVTGASGRLGRLLVAELQRRGWQTRALVHARPAPEADEEVHGSLDDPPSLARATDGVEAIVHLAGLTHSRDPGAYERTNTDGTAAIFAAAQAVGVGRVVHVSTRAISAEGGAYSLSKLRAEEIVRASSVPHVIVRLAEVYGAGGREGVDRLIAAARSGSFQPVAGDGQDILCPVHVDDAVGALAGALEAPDAIGKTYTIGGRCLTYAEFAEECRRVLGGGRHLRVPLPVIRAVAVAARFLPLPLYPDQVARLRSPKEAPTPEAERELSFRVRGLEEGLRAAD